MSTLLKIKKIVILVALAKRTEVFYITVINYQRVRTIRKYCMGRQRRTV